jgi:hypothetical protein
LRWEQHNHKKRRARELLTQRLHRQTYIR